MSNFNDALKIVIGLEGGYVNDPKDKGGRTYRGISEKNWPGMWESGQPSDSLVSDFYYFEFWKIMHCDYFHRAIGFELFDAGVNCGTVTASIFLQKAYNLVRKETWKDLKVDGDIGPKTKRAIRQMRNLNLNALVKAMNGYQFIHYEKQNDYYHIRGWIANRIEFERV